MTHWLKTSRDHFLENLLEFVWRQWTLLGVVGVTTSKTVRIIDPEALLLFSLGICRYDPRLFDEIIDWLMQYGHLINVQRLQRHQKKYTFNCGPQLSAVADLLSQKATYKLKWFGLAKTHQSGNQPEPLFFDKQGHPLPYPDKQNICPEFLSHGLLRGRLKLRGYSQSFNPQNPACLLLQMRALLGIHCRAELLCLLAATHEIHPTGAARQTGYSQKNIQTTLVEMSQSGLLETRTTRKVKYYRLKSGPLEALLKPNHTTPQWVEWPSLLSAAEQLWIGLHHHPKASLDPLLLSSELLKLLQSIADRCSETGISKLDTDLHLAPEDIPEYFQSTLNHLTNFLRG